MAETVSAEVVERERVQLSHVPIEPDIAAVRAFRQELADVGVQLRDNLYISILRAVYREERRAQVAAHVGR